MDQRVREVMTPNPRSMAATASVMEAARTMREHDVGDVIVLEADRPRRSLMARCDVCGNDYEKTMKISLQGRTATFDCFECAIHALAPTCEHCACRIIGHGVEANGRLFCCSHCAHAMGLKEVRA